MKILITLSYLGGGFCGYQVQAGKRSVQGELTRAGHELFSFDCDITGCSRTDSGVHANMFCATITRRGCDSIDTALTPDRIVMALNAHLSDDICVYDAKWVDSSFHPRYDVKYKEYVYRMYNGVARVPFEVGRSLILKKKFTLEQIEKMNEAARGFVGKHDFAAFCAQGSKVASTVREVKYARVECVGDIIEFTVAADGFLYNMVRIMAGTLLSVAEGKMPQGDIGKIIESRDRKAAGQTAPPEGLYLNRVVY